MPESTERWWVAPYFLVPDVGLARNIIDELLDHDVPERQIHVVARDHDALAGRRHRQRADPRHRGGDAVRRCRSASFVLLLALGCGAHDE